MSQASHYPVFADLRGQLVVVIGGDETALRRARSFTSRGADVVVIAPEPIVGLLEMEAAGELTVERRDHAAGDLGNAMVVVCTVDDPGVRSAVYAEAHRSGTLVTSGDPSKGNFVAPAVVRRGSLQIAVSTGGATPELARRVKREIGERYGAVWEEFAELNAIVRGMVYERVGDDARRREMLEGLAADDGVLDRLAAGDMVDPEQVFRDLGGETG